VDTEESQIGQQWFIPLANVAFALGEISQYLAASAVYIIRTLSRKLSSTTTYSEVRWTVLMDWNRSRNIRLGYA
jgi:hypothetical protein